MLAEPTDIRILGAASTMPRVRASLSNTRIHRLTVIVPPFANAIDAIRVASQADRACLVFGDNLNMAAAATLFAAGADGFETDLHNLPAAARAVAAGGVSLDPISAAAILQLARTTFDPRLDQLSAVARSCAQGMPWSIASLAADPHHLHEQLHLLRALI